MDLSLFCRPMQFGAEGGWTALSLVRPLSRRSGCVPAEPYPPLRSVVVYPKRLNVPPQRGGKRLKKPLTFSSAFIYGAGILAGSLLSAGFTLKRADSKIGCRPDSSPDKGSK